MMLVSIPRMLHCPVGYKYFASHAIHLMHIYSIFLFTNLFWSKLLYSLYSHASHTYYFSHCLTYCFLSSYSQHLLEHHLYNACTQVSTSQWPISFLVTHGSLPEPKTCLLLCKVPNYLIKLWLFVHILLSFIKLWLILINSSDLSKFFFPSLLIATF